MPDDMPMVTVRVGRLTLPNGEPYQGRLQFTAPDLVTIPALDDGLGGAASLFLADGDGSISLIPHDVEGMDPQGWSYRVDGLFSNAPNWTRYIALPSSPDTVVLMDILEPDPVQGEFVTLLNPASLGAAAFLDVGQTAGTVAGGDDDRFGEGGGGSGTPSSTVVAGTSFGQSSTAGVATAYSRGDHSHGTPATPTKATVGLGNVDNTSDLGKPLSTATTNALTGKADLVGGTVPLAQLPTPSVQGALTKTSNLSDLANAGTARTNLGLGTAAVAAATAFDAAGAAATAQSAAGTYTDGKIASEVTRANAAYDAAGAASTVAGNLTAHTGATTSVHGIANTSALVTTSDTRLTNSRTPSGSAGGDLGGTYPSPTVAKVNGVAVSGTPSSGQVLTASSGTAASWQAPSGGGGGGSAIVSVADDRVDEEIIVLTNTPTWAIVRTSGGTAIGKSIPVAAGDRVWVSPSFMYAGSQYQLDMAVMAGDGSVSRYASSSGSGTTPGPEGYAPMYTQAASFPHASGIAQFVVGAGEIDGDGMFTVNLAYIAGSLSGTDNKIYAGSGYIARWFMANMGPAPS